MKIVLVGAGRVATALAVRWTQADHTIVVATPRSESSRARVAIHLPDADIQDLSDDILRDAVVILGVPDAAIAAVTQDVAPFVDASTTVAHLSGASGLDVLAPAAAAGAATLALHPLQTFPTVEAAVERLPGTPIGITAATVETATLGTGLASDAGGAPFALTDEARPLYHAAAVFASNLSVATLGAADELMAAAGVDPALLGPLVEASVANARALGAGNALTGPAIRGDASTIATNLEAIGAARPDLVESYIALTRLALQIGGDRVPPDAATAIEEVLQKWS